MTNRGCSRGSTLEKASAIGVPGVGVVGLALDPVAPPGPLLGRCGKPGAGFGLADVIIQPLRFAICRQLNKAAHWTLSSFHDGMPEKEQWFMQSAPPESSNVLASIQIYRLGIIATFI